MTDHTKAAPAPGRPQTETMAVLPLLTDDLAELALTCCRGQLGERCLVREPDDPEVARMDAQQRGGAFGDGNCVRLSYAASEKDLREAISRIKNALAKLS